VIGLARRAARGRVTVDDAVVGDIGGGAAAAATAR
jgi:hypothetical protein